MKDSVVLGPSNEGMTEAIRLSRESAIEANHSTIGIDDLTIGILRSGNGRGAQIIQTLGVNTKKLEDAIRDNPDTRSADESASETMAIPVSKESIFLTSIAEESVKNAHQEAARSGASSVGTEHLLLSILRDESQEAAQVLISQGVTYEKVAGEIDNLRH
jgi:ATP-dependent Clp protease ATP-binding subunit ClpC